MDYLQRSVALSRTSFESGGFPAVSEVHFVIPKEKTNTRYAYEDNLPMHDHLKNFNTPLHVHRDGTLLGEAHDIYELWVKKLEANQSE